MVCWDEDACATYTSFVCACASSLCALSALRENSDDASTRGRRLAEGTAGGAEDDAAAAADADAGVDAGSAAADAGSVVDEDDDGGGDGDDDNDDDDGRALVDEL